MSDAPSSKPAPQPRSPRLAEVVAARIEEDIFKRGWPTGEVLGSEADLIARYGVSRAVFREAVRIVEHQKIARTRRGPGGGLIVTEPDPVAIQNAARLYLQYAGVKRRHLFETRSALELAAVASATEQITEEGIERLREALAQEDEREAGAGHSRLLHEVISDLTGNSAMSLFVGVLAKLDEELVVRRWDAESEPPPAAAMAASHRAHTAIVEAIVSGDVPLAQHRMRRHLDAIAHLIGEQDDELALDRNS